jgi:flagellar hook-associated protein 1 FlgK
MTTTNISRIGISGMMASKAAVATTGHNIANANTEGYSRQRVLTEAAEPQAAGGSHGLVGTGTLINRIERVNDEYVEKQIRNAGRDMANMEEKDLVLKQTEDVFNEMNGDGLNRLVSRFFNEFRKLSNEPENEGIRQSVREASQAMVNDFHRLRSEVEEVRKHIDARIEGDTKEITDSAKALAELNQKIVQSELGGAPANDLRDKRDQVLKKLASYMDISTHTDGKGNFAVDVRGVGPLVCGNQAENFSVRRSPADDQGKPEGAFDVKTSGSAAATVTHEVKGGKLGALLEVRDQTLSTILNRLDEMAYTVSDSVNQVHRQGFDRFGNQGIDYFKELAQKDRAAEYIGLSDEVMSSSNHIAAAMQADSPGDNRVALAISNIQDQRVVNDGKSTLDEWYNSIVGDVGVVMNRNRSTMNQQRDIITQLNKTRDQISGVSMDEETANLMQFQHTYDASAKVIQVADDMLKTVLELKR